jgi:hypothetical protein
MRIRLVTQPDQSSTTLYRHLTELLDDQALSRFVAVTAWVNHRALSRLVPSLRSFRAHGTAEIVVGIDEGGATEQGLRLAASEFDRSSVFFSTDDRTFHPKLYFGLGGLKSVLLVGSNNLTPGGLFHNFETALAIEMTLGRDGPPEDRELTDSVADYIDRLYDDTGVCKPLGANLEAILRDQTYRVRDESLPRPRAGSVVLSPDGDRDTVQRPRLFGRSAKPLTPPVPTGDPIPPSLSGHPTPPPGRRGRQGIGAPSRGSGGAQASPALAPAPSPAIRRWFTSLTASAAQHPPNPNSQLTGNLRLGQAGHGIDQTKYFRNEFFAGLGWIGDARPRGIREAAAISMDIVIDGRILGVRTFQVSHAPWREAGQHNVTTFLHFGAIATELRAINYTGRVLTLEQFPSGNYRLTIDTAETGPFKR